MLSDSSVSPILPAADLDRARRFYERTLGLSVVGEFPGGLIFGAGNGTSISVYQRARTKAEHTVATFQVEDIEAEIRDLIARGVKFEHYNMQPGPVTNSLGIAEDPDGGKAAWFTDPEGNILSLVQIR